MVIKKIGLLVEFFGLFFCIPVILYIDSFITHPSSVLLPSLVFIILILKYKTDFKIRELFYFQVDKKTLKTNMYILLVIFLLLLLAVRIFIPDKLFNLPKSNILIWLAICFFYPVFSAYAQEIIFRLFFFKRYSGLFPKTWIIIVINALCFSFAHIVYYSTVSIILTFLAGIYLSLLYLKTKSVLFTSLVHGILGLIIFTIGLGEYFWLDMLDYIK